MFFFFFNNTNMTPFLVQKIEKDIYYLLGKRRCKHQAEARSPESKTQEHSSVQFGSQQCWISFSDLFTAPISAPSVGGSGDAGVSVPVGLVSSSKGLHSPK